MRNVIPALFLALVCPGSVHAQLSIVTDGILERDARPGATYEDVIRVQNLTDAPQEVRVYRTDYLFFADGSNLYDPPGTAPRSNGPWVEHTPGRATIPPRQVLSVRLTVDVPPVDTLEGSYWSMVMVEGVPPGSPESSRPAEETLGIRHVVRHAVQVVTHVGEGALRFEFTNPHLLQTESGEHRLQVDLENVGERAARADVRAELYDMAGTRVREAAGRRLIVYPGTSVRQRLELGRVPPGRYQALVVADVGDEIFGAQYTLNF